MLKRMKPDAVLFSLQSSRSNLSRFYSVKPLIRCATLEERKKEVHSTHSRNLTCSSRLFKKKSRADREAEEETRRTNSNSNDDPWDFSSLHEGIKDQILKLQSDLAKLRTGGRFNPDLLENLRVSPQRQSKKTERLGDLAQIIPKGGRTVIIHVGEKAHVKSIVSAIQSSPLLNLQPVQDTQNPTVLTVPVPPPTKESRDLALMAASKAGETATLGVRAIRGNMQKRLRNIELKKLARPDDMKKAHKEMEKIVEKGIIEVKKTVDVARKAMEQT